MSRRSRKKSKREELTERATELADKAKEVGGHSGEALKEFAEKARDAAREMVESIEQAAKNASEPEPRRKGRKLRTVLALAIGIGVLTNERARNAITSVIKRARSDGSSPAGDAPEIWRPSAQSAPNGHTETAKPIEKA